LNDIRECSCLIHKNRKQLSSQTTKKEVSESPLLRTIIPCKLLSLCDTTTFAPVQSQVLHNSRTWHNRKTFPIITASIHCLQLTLHWKPIVTNPSAQWLSESINKSISFRYKIERKHFGILKMPLKVCHIYDFANLFWNYFTLKSVAMSVTWYIWSFGFCSVTKNYDSQMVLRSNVYRKSMALYFYFGSRVYIHLESLWVAKKKIYMKISIFTM
jgi:hypothetical protein